MTKRNLNTFMARRSWLTAALSHMTHPYTQTQTSRCGAGYHHRCALLKPRKPAFWPRTSVAFEFSSQTHYKGNALLNRGMQALTPSCSFIRTHTTWTTTARPRLPRRSTNDILTIILTLTLGHSYSIGLKETSKQYVHQNRTNASSVSEPEHIQNSPIFNIKGLYNV